MVAAARAEVDWGAVGWAAREGAGLAAAGWAAVGWAAVGLRVNRDMLDANRVGDRPVKPNYMMRH